MRKILVASISSVSLMFCAAVAGAQPARARIDETLVRAEANLDDADGSSNQTAVPAGSPTADPVAQGAPIPPTLEQLGLERVRELERKHVPGAKAAARQLAAEDKAMKRELAAERKAMERELAAEQRELAAEKKAAEQRLASEREAAKRIEAAKAEMDRLNAAVEALKAKQPAGGRQDH